MSEKILERLNAHRDWANALYVEWFSGGFGSGVDAESVEYCRKMFSHVLLAEEVWIGRILDLPYRHPWAAVLETSEMHSMRMAHKPALEKILGGAAGPMDRVFSFRRFDGAEAELSIADALTHVCTHGVYHRGQVAASAARAGLKMPGTDFFVFAGLE